MTHGGWSRARALWKEHWFIAIIAGALAAIVIFPLVWFRLVIPPGAYQGINPADFGIDELWYLSRGKEILEGHGLGNAVLLEGKDGQESHFQYGEYVLTLPLRWLGLGDRVDIVMLYHVYNVIGVMALVVSIYFFIWQLARDRRVAMLSAAFVVGGYSIVYYHRLFTPELIVYGRAISPYTHSVVFFVFLNLFVRAMQRRGWRPILFAGCAFGMLFYTYFFAWTFAGAMLASYAMIRVAKKDFFIARRTLAVGAVGLLLGSYNLVRMAQFFSTPDGAQRSFFHWTIYSHWPLFNITLAVFTVCVIGLVALRRSFDTPTMVVVALTASGWFALNQQILTGRIVQPFHYHWYFIVPTVIMGGFLLVWPLVPLPWKKPVFVIGMVILMTHAAVGQFRASAIGIDTKLAAQQYRPFLDILNRDSAPGVVLAPDDKEIYLYTVYTSRDVFWNSTGAVLYTTSIERMEDVLFVYCYLATTCRDNFVAFYRSAMDDRMPGSMYRDVFASIEGVRSGLGFYEYQAERSHPGELLLRQREDMLRRFGARYAEVSASPSAMRALLDAYDIRYVVLDRQRHPEWSIDGMPSAARVADSGNMVLYRIDE